MCDILTKKYIFIILDPFSSMVSPFLLGKNGVKFVEAKFLDLNGVLRSRTFPVDRYLTVIREIGFGFDGSSVGFFPVEDSDAVAMPLEDTLRITPYKDTAMVLCDVLKDGKSFHGFGKNILKNLLEKIPYDVFIGPEIEFYLTKDGRPVDEAGYMSSSPMDVGEGFKKEFMNFLQESNSDFNIQVAHHEVGPSQHEVELKYDKAIPMINKLISYKYLLRKIAEQKGFEVTYMPKPFFEKAGSGMHFHISLWEGENPLFFENENEISDLAKSFIAGILEHSREIALVTNGTVNSYKRLIAGYEAPVYCVWGFANRSAEIRIPKYRILKPSTARIEVRSLDGLNDHFLACAVLIKAGMIGIEKEMEAPEPFQKNAYRLTEDECEKLGVKMLPKSLGEAIEEAKKGTIVKGLLGNDLFDNFVEDKEREWEQYCDYLNNNSESIETKNVTNWELKKYFCM